MVETTIKLTGEEYGKLKKDGFDNKPFVIERQDKYIIICHGLSLFKIVTFLKTGLTTAGLRRKLALDKKRHIELYCCYGSKVINNDINTTIMNMTNEKATVYDPRTYNIVFSTLSSMFGSSSEESDYEILIKW